LAGSQIRIFLYIEVLEGNADNTEIYLEGCQKRFASIMLASISISM